MENSLAVPLKVEHILTINSDILLFLREMKTYVLTKTYGHGRFICHSSKLETIHCLLEYVGN